MTLGQIIVSIGSALIGFAAAIATVLVRQRRGGPDAFAVFMDKSGAYADRLEERLRHVEQQNADLGQRARDLDERLRHVEDELARAELQVAAYRSQYGELPTIGDTPGATIDDLDESETT